MWLGDTQLPHTSLDVCVQYHPPLWCSEINQVNCVRSTSWTALASLCIFPTLHYSLKDIWDMSFTQQENTQLVFMAGADKGLFAYNWLTGKLEWGVPGDEVTLHAGLTNDERGHLFHCISIDGNRCIKMFAAAKGRDLGVLQVKEDKFIGPWRICWCKETSSLIVAHKRGAGWFISVVSVKYPE